MQPSVANATNIDTLLANKEGIECVKVPPENLQDKVFFIFNNLSMSNMDSKVSQGRVDFAIQHFCRMMLCHYHSLYRHVVCRLSTFVYCIGIQ